MTNTPEDHRVVTPLIMGVVNASLDSLTGGVDAAGAALLAIEMAGNGAAILDCGGQSLRTDQVEISVEQEIDRVVPVIEAVRKACPGSTISVDTYRAPVARAGIAAGATIVNDPSGLLDDELAEVVHSAGVDLVLAYSRATPKIRMTRDALVEDPLRDAVDFLRAGLDRLSAVGVDPSQVIVDPGPDLGKSPEQSIAVLHDATAIRVELGGPRFLWAVSRKDFIGALVHRTPSNRAAGTFGALAAIHFAPGDVVRVHDVAATADFFAVRAAIGDGYEGILDLPEAVRYETDPGP